MRRREFVKSSVVLLGGWALAAHGQPTKKISATGSKISLGAAINKGGRQRMLSQRMVKAYAQLGLGVLPARSMKILESSTALFESQLTELLAFAPSPEVKGLYQELNAAWPAMRENLLTAPSPETGSLLFKSSEDILKIAHRATVELEKLSGRPAGKLVNIAGRQRMLSQRAAKLYMLREWKIPQATGQELKVVRDEFKQALSLLKAAPESTPEIKAQLEMAETQWLFFDRALEFQKSVSQDEDISRRNVATTSEHLLEIFEMVTGLYERGM